jgi:hypothetical protein
MQTPFIETPPNRTIPGDGFDARTDKDSRR